MKQFSIKRVWNLTKFNVISHKWFYVGLTLSSVLAFSALLAFNAIYRNMCGLNTLIFDSDVNTGMVTMGIMSCLILACMYHPLRTKKDRINFMLLPASRCEKFLSLLLTNWLTMILMSLLTLVVMFWVNPNLLEYYGIGDTTDYTVLEISEMNDYQTSVTVISIFIYPLALLPSIVVAINSLLYKNNIIPTGIVTTTVLVLSLLFIGYIDIHLGFSRGLFFTILLLSEFAVIALCWVVIVVRFKRMHICGLVNK